VYHRRNYFVDVSHLSRGKVFEVARNDVSALLASAKPLEEADCEGHSVEVLIQLSVSATASPEGVRLGISRARPVSAPLKSAKRSRTRSARTSAPCASDSASSAPEEEEDGSDSDFQVMGEIAADVDGSSADSSCPSVDTEEDSGLDDFVLAVRGNEGDLVAEVDDLEEPGAKADDAEPGGPADARGPRHPAGTWTVWSNLWVYITKTPGFSDVKCSVKGPLRNSAGGLGAKGLSKTLTPAHYGETWDNPVRSLLLLRAWAVWRVQQGGWASARECRQRELDRERVRLEADLRAAVGEGATAPLFR